MKELLVLIIWLCQRNGIVQNGRQVRIGRKLTGRVMCCSSGLFKLGGQRGNMCLSCVATKISETRKKVRFQSFDKVKYR